MDPIVGDERCNITQVCSVLEKLESYKTIITKLNEIALKLQVPPDQLHRVSTSLKLGTITPFEALHEILSSWRSKSSDEARLGRFLEILERCELGHASDSLRRHFAFGRTPELKQYVVPPEGVIEFLKSDHKLLVVCTRDKTVTASKLKDTTPCVHTDNSLGFANNLQLANDKKLCSFECNDDFRLADVLNLTSSKSKCKFVIITEEDLTDVQELCYDSEHTLFVEDKLKWSQLSASNQVLTTEKHVKLSGKFLSLKEFSRKAGRLQDDMLDGTTLLQIINNKKPNLDKSTVPETIPYYVRRRINPRRLLNPDGIFKAQEFIFMISGIDPFGLSRYARPRATDSSTNQRRMERPTVQYMILDMESDFEEISKKFDAPAHWINHEKDKFYWVRSSGRLDTIHKALEIKKSQSEYSEEALLDFLQKKSKYKNHVVISDTPGMGKTQLLSSLAGQLVSQGEIVLFGVMSKIVTELKEKLDQGEPMKMAILNILSSLGGQTNPVAMYWKQALNNGDDQINVMLDGLDEINYLDLELVKSVLKMISTLENVQIWVTTRPHYLETLENWLQVLGHNIQSFNSEDQVRCLVNYWMKISRNNNEQTMEEERLRKFAKTCLETLHTRMKSRDRDIAGVPLQCMLIGEVFAQEARNFGNPDNVHKTELLPPSINIRSITDLYARLIEKKLKQYSERYPHSKYAREELMLAHMTLGVQLIFPEWKKIVPGVEIEIGEILNVGLLEKLSEEDDPTFIHRTIAEYLTASFVVNLLSKCQGENSDEFLAQILETGELKTSSSQEGNYGNYNVIVIPMTLLVFKHNVIVYFVENLLQPATPALRTNTDIRSLAHACVSGNFVNLFNHFDKAKLFDLQSKRVFDKDMVFASVRFSELSLIQKICEKHENIHSLNIRHLIAPLDNEFAKIHNLNVLCLAVKFREYSIVEYFVYSQGFLELLKDNERSIRDIIYYCVEGSKNDDESLVFQKKLTLKLLHELNPHLFEDTSSAVDCTPPLLCPNIHVALLCEMISLEFDMSSYYDPSKCNMLAKAAQYLKTEDFHQLVSLIPSMLLLELLQLIQLEQPTLHSILSSTNLELDPRTFQVFKKAGMDFNAVDGFGDSPLDVAVKNYKSIATYEQLVLHGARLTPLGQNEWTIVHTALAANNFPAFQYFAHKLSEDEDLKIVIAEAKGWSDLKKLDLGKLGMALNLKGRKGQNMLHRVNDNFYASDVCEVRKVRPGGGNHEGYAELEDNILTNAIAKENDGNFEAFGSTKETEEISEVNDVQLVEMEDAFSGNVITKLRKAWKLGPANSTLLTKRKFSKRKKCIVQ